MKTPRTLLFFFAIVTLLAGGCASQPPTENPQPTPQTVAIMNIPSRTVEITLRTAVDGQRIFYVGVGGEIDGIVNPDLIVQKGDKVHAVLLNGDGLPHDLTFSDLDARTSLVAGKGQETDVTFVVNEIGTFAYYCTVAGHRQAGQEGKLIVE